MQNRKDKFLKETVDNRSYKIVMMKKHYNYCYICSKRSGNFYITCSPSEIYGFHGNYKPIYSFNFRRYRTWKYQRKNQYKN